MNGLKEKKKDRWRRETGLLRGHYVSKVPKEAEEGERETGREVEEERRRKKGNKEREGKKKRKKQEQKFFLLISFCTLLKKKERM